ITPLKDGMNLVSKEYCVCNPGDGALILSEFAGAAAQLGQWALMVNPHDVVGCAAGIHRAFSMPAAERRARMAALRRVVQSRDVYWWVESVLRAGEVKPVQIREMRRPVEVVRLMAARHSRPHDGRAA